MVPTSITLARYYFLCAVECRLVLFRKFATSANAILQGGKTALAQAAMHSLDIVRFLIGHGAVVDITDDDGVTALMHAAEAGREDICRLLVAHGADVQHRCNVSPPPPYTHARLPVPRCSITWDCSLCVFVDGGKHAYDGRVK
jgi:hypothetical protein